MAPAIAVELFETKHPNPLLNGISIDVVATSDLRVGAGVAKNIVETDLVKIDAGLYVVKPLFDLFRSSAPVELRIGVGAQIRF